MVPLTGLPPRGTNGVISFLPPEAGAGRGMGHLSYTIRAKPVLASGTEIRTVGLITFAPEAGLPTFRTDLADATNHLSAPNPNRQARVTSSGGDDALARPNSCGVAEPMPASRFRVTPKTS